jgi:hypothetical protein
MILANSAMLSDMERKVHHFYVFSTSPSIPLPASLSQHPSPPFCGMFFKGTSSVHHNSIITIHAHVLIFMILVI